MEGIGVLLRMMCGDKDSIAAFTSALNKPISAIKSSDVDLIISFEDKTAIRFFDDGQSCCENRYMEKAEGLDSFVGQTILGAEVKDQDELPDEYGNHEVCLLEIKTSNGLIGVKFHNEHNGYYGGFYITVATQESH